MHEGLFGPGLRQVVRTDWMQSPAIIGSGDHDGIVGGKHVPWWVVLPASYSPSLLPFWHLVRNTAAVIIPADCRLSRWQDTERNASGGGASGRSRSCGPNRESTFDPIWLRYRSNPNSNSFGHWRIQLGWKLWLIPSAALRCMDSIRSAPRVL